MNIFSTITRKNKKYDTEHLIIFIKYLFINYYNCHHIDDIRANKLLYLTYAYYLTNLNTRLTDNPVASRIGAMFFYSKHEYVQLKYIDYNIKSDKQLMITLIQIINRFGMYNGESLQDWSVHRDLAYLHTCNKNFFLYGDIMDDSVIIKNFKYFDFGVKSLDEFD